jgi:hypothetical protein
MQKRKALAAAGAVTMTALAATVALGTNMGLFGLTNDPVGPGSFGPVGEAKATPTAPVVATERTEVVDVPVPYYVSDGTADPASGGAAPVPGVAAATSGGTSGGGSSGGGHRSSATASTTAQTTGHVEDTHAPETHEPETHEPETHEPESHEPESSSPGADD